MIQRKVSLDGLMTIGMLESGLRIADFMCCEDVEMEKFIGHFKVQGMHNGNLYLEELPKRNREKPQYKFREDNSSLTLGRDGYWYFWFAMPDGLINELPEQLVRQASLIAQKVLRALICKKEVNV